MAWPNAAPSVCLTLFIVAHEPTVVSVSLVSACADDAGISVSVPTYGHPSIYVSVPI